MSGARFFQFTGALFCHLEQMVPTHTFSQGIFFSSVVFISKVKQSVIVWQLNPYSSSKWQPILCDFTKCDTLQPCIGSSHICVVLRLLWRGGARASPHVAPIKTVGQKRKWKCHVNVFVMLWDHVWESEGVSGLCYARARAYLIARWQLRTSCLCYNTSWKISLPTFGNRLLGTIAVVKIEGWFIRTLISPFPIGILTPEHWSDTS